MPEPAIKPYHDEEGPRAASVMDGPKKFEDLWIYDERETWWEKFERRRSMTPKQRQAEDEKRRLEQIEEEKLRRQERVTRKALEVDKQSGAVEKFLADLTNTTQPKMGKFPRRF
jgi:hypothetical protein